MISIINRELPEEVHVNEDDEVVEIRFPKDIERSFKLYREEPIFHEVVQNDIRALNSHEYGDRDIRQYQPSGFLVSRRGSTAEVPFQELGISP